MKRYGCDFETLTFDSDDFKKQGHTDVFLWCVRDFTKDRYWIGKDIKDFIYDFVLKGHTKKVLYFHNLSFDGNFIYKFLLREKDKGNLDFINFNTYNEAESRMNKKEIKNYLETLWNGNKIYNISFHLFFNNKQYDIDFKCSYLLTSASIEALGKDMKMNKYNDNIVNLEKKYNKSFYDLGGYRMKKEIEDVFIDYIKNDTLILVKAVENLENELNNIDEFKKYYKGRQIINRVYNYSTIGGISYELSEKYIDRNLSHCSVGFKVSARQYRKFKKFFYGGYTEFNERYQNKDLDMIDIDNGYMVDINSSYPNQMSQLLPYGEFLAGYNDDKNKHINFCEVEVESAIIKEKYSNIPILKNWTKEKGILERYVKIHNNFTCYYMEEEWEFIKKIYDVKIKKIVWYHTKADYLLKGLIERLYHFKSYYKKEKKPSIAHTHKILLNSMYGRQAKRMVFNEEFLVNKEFFDLIKEKRKNNEYIQEFYIGEKAYNIDILKNNTRGNFNIISCKPLISDENEVKFSNILIGAVITSRARLQLWNMMYKIGWNNVIYCDTDSILFKAKKLPKCLDNLIDDEELGKWDIEAENIKYVKILGAKRYVIFDSDKKIIKKRYAGVKKLKLINEDNFSTFYKVGETLKCVNIKREEDDYGIYFIESDYNVKEGTQ